METDLVIVVSAAETVLHGGPATLLAAADALLAAGATGVHAFATHGLFAPGAPEALGAASSLTEIAVTDTVALDRASLPEKVAVVTASELLADSIRNVFEDRSVSELFAGENELF